LRLLQLTDRLGGRGGADSYFRDLVEWVSTSGHEAEQTVVSGRGEDKQLSRHVDAMFTVRGLSSRVSSGKGLAQLGELVRSSDVVHIHNVMNPVALELVAASGKGVVTVQDHRVFCPGRGKVLPQGDPCKTSMNVEACEVCFDDKVYAQKTLALTEDRLEAVRKMRVIVLSKYMAQELSQHGVDSTVIPPGVPSSDTVSNVGEGYIMGGRVVTHKAHSSAEEAWRMSGVESPLKVAGDGPELSLLGGVERLGWLGRSELREALRCARALLFPSDWQEPFGILGAEALAQGTPVIAMRGGGVEDWAKQGVCLVERGDTDGMANAIWRLEHDDEHTASLGALGWNWVTRHLAPDEQWGRVINVYEELMTR